MLEIYLHSLDRQISVVWNIRDKGIAKKFVRYPFSFVILPGIRGIWRSGEFWEIIVGERLGIFSWELGIF